MTFDIDALLYRYLTEGIARNHKRHVGLELEYPIIRVGGGDIDMDVMRGLFQMLKSIGFDRQTFSGRDPLKATDAQGNSVTFDTCYAVLEYVTTSAPSMPPLYERYRTALCAVQRYMLSNGHMVCGIGYNPTRGAITAPKLRVDLTMAIGEVLSHGFAGARASYLDFYERIASEQVHFNTAPDELPTLMCMLTYLDLANMLLFSNSPASLDDGDYLCVRHRLYRSSRLAGLGMTGAQPLEAQTLKDYQDEYRSICMFSRHRDGRREVFDPVRFDRYFGDERYGAIEDDIWDFDIERNVVTTRYGTVEYRTLCAQPFSEAFVPSAFTLGLRTKLHQTLELCRDFYGAHGLTNENALLDRAARDGRVEGVPAKALEAWLGELLRLSSEGLTERGYGEETFLKPLYERQELLDCPAKRFIREKRVKGDIEALTERGTEPKELAELMARG